MSAQPISHRLGASGIGSITVKDAARIPIFEAVLENHDSMTNELRSIISHMAETSPSPLTRSNAGGWHSAVGLETWDYPCIPQLIEEIQWLAREAMRHLGNAARAE